MNDLTGLICPQLFVQFKFCLKQGKAAKQLQFRFSDDADTSDVMRYLDNHNFHYRWQNNILTVTDIKEES